MQKPFLFNKLCAALLLTAGIVLFPLLLAGCGGGGSSSSTSATPAPPATPSSVSATAPDGLTATLSEDTATVAVGGTATYTLTINNPTSQPITLVPDTNGFSFTPSVGGAGLLVTNSSGQSIGGPVGVSIAAGSTNLTLTLNPQQSTTGTLSEVFPNGQGPGSYFATATVDILPSGATTPVPLSIGPLILTAQ